MTLLEYIRKSPKLISRAIVDPKQLIRLIVSIYPRSSFSTKLQWDAMLRPNYGYGLFMSALQARALGIDKISAIEFGVAAGRGLLELEWMSDEITKELGISIDIYGFDTAEGMPKPLDYKDLPYLWRPGLFEMNYDALNQNSKKSSLILGNISDTIINFINDVKPSPIGFVSIDVDYYSSTVNSLKLFEAEHEFFLPRTFCYFDDIVGDDWELHTQFAGELLAINEFNNKNKYKKIDKINGLSFKRLIKSEWNDKMYVFHDFKHPLYTKNIVRPKKYFNRGW